VPVADILLHARTAQVEIAIAEADFLVDFVAVALDVECRRLCFVQNGDRKNFELNVAVQLVCLDILWRTRIHFTFHFDDPFRANGFSDCLCFGRVRQNNPLNLSGHIAEIEEDELSLVAADVDPAGDGDFLAEMSLQIFYVYSFHLCGFPEKQKPPET